ncbi:MAG: NAD(P)/FAD-dependent oxidoreductase [Bradymonadaceae bacterium]
MRKLVILGSGFGGYHAARRLENSLSGRRRVQLTVVTDRAHFLFSPLLYSVATGELDIPHVAIDLVNEYSPETELIIDRVEAIDLDRRVLVCAERGELEFDYLLLATGSVVNFGAHPHWREHVLTFKDSRDALALREHVQQRLDESPAVSGDPEALKCRLKIVIIGAGATGVELAAELSSAVRERLPDLDDEAARSFELVLIEAQDRILPRHGEEVQSVAKRQLADLGIKVHLDERVVDVGEGRVELTSGEVIEAETIIYCGGVRAPDLLSEAGFDTDELGRVQVDATLQVKGHRGIYAVGDGSVLDEPLPMEGDVARQQAELAAQNLLAELSGRMRREFSFEPTGDLITLGRDNAALSLRGVALEGKAAWLMYRLFYTAMMPRALKKARLLKGWVAKRAKKNGRRSDPPLLEGAPPMTSFPPVEES